MTNDIYRLGLDLWTRWTEMWNGRPELALELVAPGFVLHLTLPETTPQHEVDSPAAVAAWVAKHRAKYERLVFHFDCGPFVDTVAGIVAGPWTADTIVNGVARPVCGMDTIAFRDGKIAEYWTIAKPVDAFGRWTKRVGCLT
jgi:hypothetical protein